jgi:hypothetical protein
MNPHITLKQWQSLIEVVDAGGYAQVAEILCKSQSAVSYAVQKIICRVCSLCYLSRVVRWRLAPISFQKAHRGIFA